MSQYDIIISGKLLDNVSSDQAVERLAALFKMPAEQAAKLVDGKPHRIKKGVDEAIARKFKAALTQSGLHTIVKASVAAAPEPTARQSAPADVPSPPKTNTPTSSPIELAPAAANKEPAEAQTSAPPAPDTSHIDLAPPGTPVLKDEERTQVQPPELDLSGITLDEMEPWSGSEQAAFEAIEPPDFGLAPPGADIETLPDTREKITPDTSKLDIEEPGAILGPKKKEPPPAPDTSHIKLEKHNPFL